MGDLILGVILQYMVYASFSCKLKHVTLFCDIILQSGEYFHYTVFQKFDV